MIKTTESAVKAYDNNYWERQLKKPSPVNYTSVSDEGSSSSTNASMHFPLQNLINQPITNPKNAEDLRPEPRGLKQYIEGTIIGIDEDFNIIKAAYGKDSSIFKISIDMCPEELQYEGLSILIKRDDNSKYKRLILERKHFALNTNLYPRVS